MLSHLYIVGQSGLSEDNLFQLWETEVTFAEHWTIVQFKHIVDLKLGMNLNESVIHQFNGTLDISNSGAERVVALLFQI